MSVECGECESDLRIGHAKGCTCNVPTFNDFMKFYNRQDAENKALAERKKRGHCCPHCGGTQGYQFTMTTDHVMTALGWTANEEAECVADTRCKVSLFECLDCGAKMRESTVEAIRNAE